MNIQYELHELNSLRQNLRNFLNERDMTLVEASIISKCSPATLSLFLNGKNNINERTKYKIKKLLGEQ